MVSLMAPVLASGFKVLSFMAELDPAEPSENYKAVLSVAS